MIRTDGFLYRRCRVGDLEAMHSAGAGPLRDIFGSLADQLEADESIDYLARTNGERVLIAEHRGQAAGIVSIMISETHAAVESKATPLVHGDETATFNQAALQYCRHLGCETALIDGVRIDPIPAWDESQGGWSIIREPG